MIGEEVFKPHIKKNLTPGANKGWKAKQAIAVRWLSVRLVKAPRLHKSQEKEKKKWQD